MSPLGHYVKYKEELATLSESVSAIPLVGTLVYLSLFHSSLAVPCNELNSMDEAMENMMSLSLVNWNKLSAVGAIVRFTPLATIH